SQPCMDRLQRAGDALVRGVDLLRCHRCVGASQLAVGGGICAVLHPATAGPGAYPPSCPGARVAAFFYYMGYTRPGGQCPAWCTIIVGVESEDVDVMKWGWPAAVVAVMTLCAPAGAARAPAATAPQYDDYRAALMAFVDARGLVDYAGLKEQRVYLDDFVTYLERLDPKTYDAWSARDRMALWIDVYNALTLRAIIDNYPIAPPAPNGSYPKNSIRQIKGVWDFNRVNVMGQSITLGYIETKILRHDFHDPRVHM